MNSSKKSSDEFAADPIKQSKPCQEEVLPPNDKAYENPNKPFPNSRQSVDQNEDTPDCNMQTSRNSKSHNCSNKYFMNTGHGDNSEKFSGFLKSDFSYESDFLKSNDTFEANSCMKTFKPNSKHLESNNTYQKKFLPTNNEFSENHVKLALNSRKYVNQNAMQMSRYSKSSNNSNSYHLSSKPDYVNEKSCKLNSNSLNSNSPIHIPGMKTFNTQSSKGFNSSNISTEKFDKYCSIFKERNSNFQKPYSYNNTKENSFYPGQHRDSYKSSLNRNQPRYNSNSDSYNMKQNYKLDQNIKMQDDVKKDSENLNSANPSEDENSEIKYQRLISDIGGTITINKETMNNFQITLKSVPDSLPDTSISSASSSLSYVSNAPISKTLSVSTLSASTTPISPVSPVSVFSNPSPVFSPVSTLESTSNLPLSNVFDVPSVNTDSIKMLISADDHFIPPPTSCESPGATDKMLSTSEKNFTFLQKVRMSIFKKYYLFISLVL